MKTMSIISTVILVFVIMVSPVRGADPYGDNTSWIPLSVYIDKEKTIVPENSYRILTNKLQQIIAHNGISESRNRRFILTANVNVLTKDITPTAPPMHALTIELTLYIGDGIDGTLFGSYSVTAKGVGETEDMAYMSALKTIKLSGTGVSSFIEEGKTRIIQYYDDNYKAILTEADALAGMRLYDNAIMILMDIPRQSEGFVSAMQSLKDIFHQKIETESAAELNRARAIWSKGADLETATEAAEILCRVDPQSSSAPQAQLLMAQISDRIRELDEREWTRTIEREQKEWELAMTSQRMDHEENMAYLNTCEKIASEYASTLNNITYTYIWW